MRGLQRHAVVGPKQGVVRHRCRGLDENAAEGKEKVTPYWWTLNANGQVNEKYPGGITGICKLLRGKSHKIVKRGNKYYAVDYQNALFTL